MGTFIVPFWSQPLCAGDSLQLDNNNNNNNVYFIQNLKLRVFIMIMRLYNNA